MTISFQIGEDEGRYLTEDGEITEKGRGKRYKSCVQGVGNGAEAVRKPRIRHPGYQVNSFLFQLKSHQYVMTPTYFPKFRTLTVTWISNRYLKLVMP